MFGKFSSRSLTGRRSFNILLFIFTLAFLIAFVPRSQAQKLQPDRPVLYKVGAKYPADLRTHGIGGTVRLALVIDARGVVQKIKPVGGNPALIEAATAAVKQWKYAPADGPTKMEVQFAFVPDQQ